MSNLELRVLGQGEAACCSPMVREPLDEQAATDLAKTFKALSDPVRLRLLSLIASHEGGEACVCDLTGPFDVSQPTISHHLKVLRDAGLVGSERRGTWVYYWVLPAALARLAALLEAPAAAAPGAPRMTRPAPLGRRTAVEFTGTGALVAVVVGSGIQAARLSPDAGVQLLANSLATVFGLGVLIALLGPVSGAHFNPAVTLAAWWTGRHNGQGPGLREVAAYVPAQIAGAIGGAVLADAMFAQPLVRFSTHDRSAPHLWLGEVVATAGLVLLILGLTRAGRTGVAPVAVACYMGAAYWFTSSTSFANPAVTIGRTFTDTFAGIAPASVLPFVGAQLVGTAVGVALVAVCFGRPTPPGADVALPHGERPLAVPPADARLALHDQGSPAVSTPAVPSVLFVCVHNAGRSQMAAAFLTHLAGERVQVSSAGSAPADTVNPAVVEAMREVGIDLSAETPKVLTTEAVRSSDVVITMGCGDACPVFPGKRYLDWTLEDPAGQGVEAVRPIRDEIERRIRTLITELGTEARA